MTDAENTRPPDGENTGSPNLTGVPPREYVVDGADRMRIDRVFTYHAPKPDQLPRYHSIREMAKQFAYMIHAYTPVSREQSIAFTKLQECVQMANAAIAINEK